ncbi:hypothetical protein [Nocardioides sp. B-3]|uniref:hypothetical protein n=1 Tax=Nocardioides sp. B-3 TaxID=2895565 RepID=UPI002152905E|nr:hypothetical protein [Nocardioides sp. B-3]UUZ58953.1 hypothetical protein LP418_23425 [Nocardioides sp. B-3]
MTHELTRADARRIAVLAQLLSGERPTDFDDMVSHLTLLQAEPTAAVAPSARVVTRSRLGTTSRPRDVDDAVADGSLIELHSMLRPAADLKLYRAEMAARPGPGELKDWQVDVRDWVEANDDTRRDILDKLEDEGPLTSKSFPRHHARAVGVERLEQRPQRADAARPDGRAWRDRPGRLRRARQALGPGRACLS